MGGLPDEIWREILNLGTKKSKLSYKDLCCISISSKLLNKLSNEDTLWSSLLTLDFPQPKPLVQSPPLKNLYKTKFERDKERKLAGHRRAVLRVESQVAVGIAKLKEVKHQLVKENEKLKVAVEELKFLERVRSASVALNAWQPEIVRGNHKRVVEQCVVPVGSRVSALEMEIRVCKQQIKVLDKGYSDEKQRLNVAKKELELIRYHHPLPINIGRRRNNLDSERLPEQSGWMEKMSNKRVERSTLTVRPLLVDYSDCSTSIC